VSTGRIGFLAGSHGGDYCNEGARTC